MKYKKIICLSLSLILLFNVLFSIALAASYTVGGNSSSVVFDWKSQTSAGIVGETRINLECFEFNVSSGNEGIYAISNSANTPYLICTIENGRLTPLSVAVYGNENGEITSDEAINNNSSDGKKTTVYLDPNKTYYICTTGDNRTSLHYSNSPIGQTVTFNFDYIEPQEGGIPYETGYSTKNFTAKNLQFNNYLHWYGVGVNQSINPDGIASTISSIDDEEFLEKLDNLSKSSNTEEKEEKAAWYQQIITWFVLLLCDAARAIINTALQYDISIDKLLFNEYPNTRLAIFGSTRNTYGEANGYLEETGMLDNGDKPGVITKYFMLFRNISIAVYIVILLYMGVNILISSTGAKKNKYKNRLIDWVKGIIILAFFPYVMKYIIVINNTIVDYMADLRSSNEDLSGVEMSGLQSATASALDLIGANANSSDIMENVRIQAATTGKIAFAILYLLLIKQLLSFIFIYFKRLLSVIFLIIIFPLVTISYAVDKIGDGKSQAFDAWVKEYTLNVFMQTFHVISYVLVMSVILAIGADSTANVILVMCGFEFIGKTEELARSLFNKVSGAKGGTVSTLNETMKTLVKVKVVKDLANTVVGGTVKRVTNFNDNVKNVKHAYREHQDTKVREWDESRQRIQYANDHSPFNPENIAIDDIGGNMHKALYEADSMTPDEYKKVLDRLYIAKNDPNRSAKFEEEFNKLNTAANPNAQDQLNKLLDANNAINETINDNHKASGEVLTEREININANITAEIINGSDPQLGKLKDFINDGHTILNADGTPVTLSDRMHNLVSRRSVNISQKSSMDAVSSMYGNIVKVDSSQTVSSSSRVQVNSHHAINADRSSLDVSTDAQARLRSKRVAVRGIPKQLATKRKEASELASRIKRYQDDIRAGRMTAMSINEGKKITEKWQELLNYRDEFGIADAGITTLLGSDFEAEVGFNVQQFGTMTAVNAIKDSTNIEGTNEEKQEILDWAGATLESNDRRGADETARAIMDRAEIDDFRDYYRRNRSSRNYVRQAGTQEKMRDQRFILEVKDHLEQDYDSMRSARNSTQTAVQLAEDVGKLIGATGSMTAMPFAHATGTAGAAIEVGMSGEASSVGAAFSGTLGTRLEETAESIIPGTAPANANKRSAGSRMARAVDNVNRNRLATTSREIDDRLLQRGQALRDARNGIDKISRRLGR